MVNSISANALSARLETLRVSYRKRLSTELEQLGLLAASRAEGCSDTEYLQRLYSCFHKLAGSAGTFGFEQLGRQASQYEQMLGQHLQEFTPMT